jgi:vibriolysin
MHYSTNYENAFWNGSSMTFGDGYTTFYPLVCLDVSAHEVSHGFTENNSGLIYSGQSGGINEAFSDMAGEAAEYYVRGTNDFMCGYDIYKAADQALRYLCNPPQDGISIDHVNDYYEGLDVHYSSGIFNNAFCLIAQSSGWNTKMAFDIFTRANMIYWTPSCTFVQGAEDAMNAAVDLGYPCQDVVNAFAQVGINLTCPGPPIANFSASPVSGGVPLTTTFTDSSQAASSWLWNFGDGGTTVSVTLTPGFNGGPWTEYWKIWIDYNDDHDFEDAIEEVFSGASTTVVTGSFTVASGINRVTRMRVSMKYASAPSPCETFTYGEVEDYTANAFTGTPNIPHTADFTFTTTDLTANFTDASTDSDGTIVSWLWNFGDGNTSTAQNPSHTYAAGGTYTVILTVTDDDSATDSTSQSVTVSDTPSVQMYVKDITQTVAKKGPNYDSTALVTIWDTNNTPCKETTVTITRSGVVSGTASAVTSGEGKAKFQSDKVPSTGPFTITVDKVTYATRVYNPALNVETSDNAYY